MKSYLIVNASVVNEGRIMPADVAVRRGRIEQVGAHISNFQPDVVIDAHGKYLIPGIIDDQVHFREPGLTHKGSIYSESRAAVAGGVTSFMEMPNTSPPALSQKLLEDKYDTALQTSLANHSFYMGVSNDNAEEVLKTDKKKVCGIKIFLGASTGNLLVDRSETLHRIFSESDMLVAVHCEDEDTIRKNREEYQKYFENRIPPECHPLIRTEEACLKSSTFAVDLAKKYGTRLHVLHVTTEEELHLFSNKIPLGDKKITSEVCVHHLWFDSRDYATLGNKIKCNPAIKDKRHKNALLKAVLNDTIDVIATDHAPHTLEEKMANYTEAPAGLPLVQHGWYMMSDFWSRGGISIEKIVEKMCHAPADCFHVAERGYIREGYMADLVLIDLYQPYTISKENIHYLCGWSPLEGHTFPSTITHVFVSGHLAYAEGNFDESLKGQRLHFSR